MGPFTRCRGRVQSRARGAKAEATTQEGHSCPGKRMNSRMNRRRQMWVRNKWRERGPLLGILPTKPIGEDAEGEGETPGLLTWGPRQWNCRAGGRGNTPLQPQQVFMSPASPPVGTE